MIVPPNVNIQIAGINFEATQQVPNGNLASTMAILNANVRSKHNNSDEAGIYVIGLEYAGEPNNFLPMYVGQASNLRSRAIEHVKPSATNFNGGQILLNYPNMLAIEIRHSLYLYWLNWNILPKPGNKHKVAMLSPFFSYAKRLGKHVLLYFNDPVIYSHPNFYNIASYPNPSGITGVGSAIQGAMKAEKNLLAIGIPQATQIATQINASMRFIEANFRFAFIPIQHLHKLSSLVLPPLGAVTQDVYLDLAEAQMRFHLWSNGEYVLGRA